MFLCATNNQSQSYLLFIFLALLYGNIISARLCHRQKYGLVAMHFVLVCTTQHTLRTATTKSRRNYYNLGSRCYKTSLWYVYNMIQKTGYDILRMYNTHNTHCCCSLTYVRTPQCMMKKSNNDSKQ